MQDIERRKGKLQGLEKMQKEEFQKMKMGRNSAKIKDFDTIASEFKKYLSSHIILLLDFQQTQRSCMKS